MKKKLFYGGIIVACICSGVAGWYIRVFYASLEPSRLMEIRENSLDYRYINPFLLVDSPREAPEYSDLNKLISDAISDEKNQKDADSISVYFRDLNTGRWTGVNEDDIYDPSSMLKVAVMIGYLKAASRDPNALLKKLPYTAKVDPGQHYQPEHPLQSGSYTARDLIQAMIIDSDNIALQSLYNNDRDDFVEVLKTLKISPPASIETTDFMSPKTYSVFFRTLYSATYLPHPIAEQALQLLTFTNFKKGLVAGLPENTIVAHKFGEHTTLLNGAVESRQLHDCGIIYYPGSPYLLCVMTKGKDFDHLEKTVSSISSIVYTKISADNPQKNK